MVIIDLQEHIKIQDLDRISYPITLILVPLHTAQFTFVPQRKDDPTPFNNANAAISDAVGGHALVANLLSYRFFMGPPYMGSFYKLIAWL